MVLNLLPALRELRSPLAAGYILLVALYFAFTDNVTTFLTNNPHGKHVADAAAHVGVAVTLAALTFVAFIIGSLWVDLVPPLCRTAILTIERPFRYVRIKVAIGRLPLDRAIDFMNELPSRTPQEQAGASYKGTIGRVVREMILQRVADDDEFRKSIDARVTRSERRNVPLEQDDDAVFRAVDVARHVTRIIDDVKNVPARLLGDEPDLWNAWDRLRAEGEFRGAIATAFAPMTLVLSLTLSYWYLLMFQISIALWILGERKARSAYGMLFESLIAGRVTVSELDRIGNHKYTYFLRSEDTGDLPTERRSTREPFGTSRKERPAALATNETTAAKKSRIAVWLQNGEHGAANQWRLRRAVWNASRHRKPPS